jgi:8-oxo-dGTP pyrophosphatase MutT (NUDIX family)
MTERSAGIILVNRGKYLLLRYGAGHWDFPKGNIEPGETPEQAALRELKEETGIEKVRLVAGFSRAMKYFYRREGQTIFKLVIFLLARSANRKVTLSWEHTDYAWLALPDALERLTYENARELLREAHEFMRSGRLKAEP